MRTGPGSFHTCGEHQQQQQQRCCHQNREELEGEEAGEEESDGELCHLPHGPVEVVAAERTDRVQVAGSLKNVVS